MNSVFGHSRAARSPRISVEALLDYASLPAPTLISRGDAVYVTVASIDDLGQWLYALGGEVRISPEIDGVQLWMLLTRTPVRADGSSVEVRVSVALPYDEPVLHTILAAVTR